MSVGKRCRWVHNPGTRGLEGHKGVVAQHRLLFSKPLHHGSPDGSCVFDRVEIGQRVRLGVLPPRRAGLGNVVGPKSVGVPAHHLGNAGVALPEEASEDLSIIVVKQSVGTGSVPARVDVTTPGRHETDEDAVLGSSGYNPVYEGKVSFVRLCDVLILDGEVSIEVRDGGNVVLGQQHGLDHVETLRGTVRKVEVNVGAIQLVKELPVRVSDPEERFICLGPVQVTAIG